LPADHNVDAATESVEFCARYSWKFCTRSGVEDNIGLRAEAAVRRDVEERGRVGGVGDLHVGRGSRAAIYAELLWEAMTGVLID